MYLKTLSLGDIHPYERNPRINDKAVEPVMKSIQKDGYRARIIVDKNGVIIAGHTRYEAMKRLGWTEAEVWIADDMTPEQIADYRIRDNLTADFAEWDFSELEAEIAEMNLDFDMSEFEGFDDIQGGVSDTPTAEEDDFDEDMPIEPKAKPGDIYQLGRHRLICGDSTDVAVIDRLMDGVKADMVFTDPPYNVDYSNVDRPKPSKTNLGKIKNDVMGEDDFIYFLSEVYKRIDENTKDNSSFYIWYADKSTIAFYSALQETSIKFNQMLIWKKPMLLGRNKYQYAYEPCIFAIKGSPYFTEDRTKTTVWDFGGYDKSKNVHPTQKPLFLPIEAINNSSKKSDIILDVFGGSGSTLIACEQLNRKCYMCELDPHYVDVIIARWEKFTGEKAVLLNG